MRREYWFLLSLSGLLLILPLGWLSLVALLVLPGLAVLFLLKDKCTLTELIGYAGTLSVLFLPLAVLVSSLLSVKYAGILLGLIVIIIGLYQYYRKAGLSIDTGDWPVMLIAFLIFLVVLAISMKTFVIDDRGLVMATTHASDLNFHMSIAQHYILTQSIPPEDPYLPGYQIVYNWFMQVAMGELTLLTGVGLFDSFKVLVSFVSALVFLDACLLGRAIFNDDLKASLVGGFVYVASSGLSWLYLLYQTVTGQEIDLFKIIIYEWKGIMGLKFDSPSLYFFLPQTQTFGMLAMIFGMYLYIVTLKKRSAGFAVVTGLVLISMVFYHMITAFPVLITLGLFFLYFLYRERSQILGKQDYKLVAVAAVPLVISAIGGAYQLSILSASAGSQIILGHHADVLVTLLAALGPLIPFALYGMYLSRKDMWAWLLIIFAALNFLFINVIEMPMTQNTYRFLVYLGLPIAIFAGLALSRWLFSGSLWKAAIAALVILVMVPSTLMIIMYYNDSGYVHATPADVKALEWIKDNTPANAIFYEEPTHFVRLPVMTGRSDVYAGEIYTWQYHNVDKQQEMEAILKMSDREQLYNTLVNDHVDYVFVGSKESGYPFAVALDGQPNIKSVYNQSGVKIYKVYA